MTSSILNPLMSTNLEAKKVLVGESPLVIVTNGIFKMYFSSFGFITIGYESI